MADGITWAWTTFPEYLDAIGNSARVIDVATQIAHGPLRAFVMGERGAANEPATPAEIETMGRLVHEAMAAGALGFSTSRTPIHRSKSGELVPGTTAGAEELVGIARSIQAAGGGVFQFAPEHVRLVEDEWPWMVDLARSTGVTVSVNLNQDRRAADLWQDVLGRLDEANAQGVPIVAQVAGRSIGILQCLEGSLHPLMFHPAYAEVAELPLTERVAALHDVERRRRLIEEIPDDGGFFRSAVIERTDGMFPVDQESIDYEPGPEHSVRAIAARRGVADLEVVLETLLADEGRGMLYTPFFNYAYGDLSMTYELHRNGNTRMGLSDAGAHCGAICDGGTPTFMLTHWTRDRTRGPKLPLELVVHRQTQQTATLYGLRDRGVLTPGARADVNVIDYDSLGFDRPRMAYDFPAGARRLVQRGRGYVATFVNGTQIVDHDEFTERCRASWFAVDDPRRPR
ncbi:MAG: amidohydrolase family protein [Ilumatobacteraceae bacterium]